jgi:hypothetical protein
MARSPEEERGRRSRRSINYEHDPRPYRILAGPLELCVAFARATKV